VVLETSVDRQRSFSSNYLRKEVRMNAIDLIVTVCAVLSPATCEERHLVFSSDVSLRQCVMAAQPYIAQWAGEHPKWTTVRWRCEYPHAKDKADFGNVTSVG
jgi:hypothetical protein